MNPTDLWWQALTDGPLLLALFDASDRLVQANPAYRAAWGLTPEARPDRHELLRHARAAGLGPVAPQADERPARLHAPGASRGYAQHWHDGRRLWWLEQRTADGGLACSGVDISGLPDGRLTVPGQLLAPQAGRELMQALLADPRAWPLCVATGRGLDADLLLSGIRSDDACAQLEDGRLLLILPATGPAQAQAIVTRLGALHLTEARWGESAAELIRRA